MRLALLAPPPAVPELEPEPDAEAEAVVLLVVVFELLALPQAQCATGNQSDERHCHSPGSNVKHF